MADNPPNEYQLLATLVGRTEKSARAELERSAEIYTRVQVAHRQLAGQALELPGLAKNMERREKKIRKLSDKVNRQSQVVKQNSTIKFFLSQLLF